MTSFIGEHTIEFTIVPILKKLLKKEFEFVVPIFPWMTREGSKVSRLIHKNDKFKIIGLYPRRPKLDGRENLDIYIKISEQIILGAIEGKNLGIPIIAGLPLVKNLWELSDNPDCLWIKLNFDDYSILDFKIEYKDVLIPEKALLKRVFKDDDEIFQLIHKDANTFDLISALEAFKRVKMSSMGIDFYSRFAFMGGYKPIYFLLK